MNSTKIITEIIKWVICIAIGGVVGFFMLMILPEGLLIVISSILVGLIAGLICAAIISQTSMKNISLFVSIFVGLVAFVLYLILLSNVNDSSETSMIGGMLAFFWPLPVFAYDLISRHSSDS